MTSRWLCKMLPGAAREESMSSRWLCKMLPGAAREESMSNRCLGQMLRKPSDMRAHFQVRYFFQTVFPKVCSPPVCRERSTAIALPGRTAKRKMHKCAFCFWLAFVPYGRTQF